MLASLRLVPSLDFSTCPCFCFPIHRLCGFSSGLSYLVTTPGQVKCCENFMIG
jgi:hypothetical protein